MEVTDKTCEVEVTDKTIEDLEDAARRHNSEICHWHVKKLRGNSHLNLSQLKIGTGAQLVARKDLKRDGQNIPKKS